MPAPFTGKRARKAGLYIEGGNRAIAKFTRRMATAMQNFVTDTEEGMEEAVDKIAATALDMTPRDTGALQGSQRKRVFLNDTGTKLIGEITYNENGQAPYAGFVHEIPADHSQANYPRNPPNAQHKFLEKAFAQWESKIASIIAKNSRARK